MMRKQFSLLACMAVLATLRGQAEVLQADLSIFGMD
jgi:hypothetical protein